MSHLRLRLCVVLGALVALAATGNALAAGNVVISQVYGGGGNSGSTIKQDFIELHNRTAASISLDGWSVQYAATAGSSWQKTDLSGTIDAGGYYLIREAQGAGGSVDTPNPNATGTIPMASGAGKVALVSNATLITAGTTCPTTGVVDFVGYGTGTTCFEGSGPTPTLSNTTAALRAGNGCTDTDNNAADFSTGAPAPRNTASAPFPCDGPPPNQPVTATCGGALTTLQGEAATRNITASDPDGTVTGFTATVTPAASGISISSQTPASSVGGTASATVSVSSTVAPGTYTVELTASNDDATPQTGTCSFTVTVTEIKTIGSVQGSVTSGGLTHRSPFAPPGGNGAGATVFIKGVVYEKTLARTSAGANQHGIFIQNTAAQADGDPTTSDGIWIFMGSFTNILNVVGGQPSYVPQVGDEVVLRGAVSEFFSFTQLSSPRFVKMTGTALDVDALIPPVEVDPPAVLDTANTYWERLESMRLRVPAASLVTDGLDVFPATADAEMWVIRGDNPIASRSGYAQRVFRDAHPLDDLPGVFDNGNGFRILVGALGLKSLGADNTVLLPPSRTFARVTNALVGGLNFSFNKYRLETTVTPALSNELDPALNAPPTAGVRSDEYSVGDYNVENLYDYRDDPTDGCDFTGNTGCTGVNPPFDYVPASDAVYQERLGLIAQQIVGDLHAPDIILVQEAEDQDICSVSGGALSCDLVNGNPDEKPDTLQELALRIQAQSGIAYDAAYDRDGSDDRGIVAALMYRTDRVELLPATPEHPVLGNTPDFSYRSGANPYNADVQNPKSLNAPLPDDVTGTRDGNEVYTRDPQVGYFRVWRNGVGNGGFLDVYAISNHFSSTPDQRVNQRREQAAYLAEIVGALGSNRVVAGGDFNVFPRPDDPLNPPSDQLGPLYDEGLSNLWETLVAEAPAAAYSYVFVGQAQTLDGQFVTSTLLDELAQTRVAHVNADFPADYPGDGARGLSDHDPLSSRFELAGIDPLENLLQYYIAAGAITGKSTVESLQRHLDLARKVGDGQIEAFIEHVEDKTPKSVTPAASQALITEAQRLLND